ncbi:DsbA family protein [Pararhodobacter oceanensis]|uniref:DsbA family protein n=1 Tax=Pararhodobacter oceanensis TaxID=2172121 RepID=UPI003A92426C
MAVLDELKMYSDFKSPFAYLAFAPFFELADDFNISARWIPFQLRLKGKGQRSVYSEYKVKYSYMDARRIANMHGGLMLRGPLKIFDTTPALIGGLFAQRQGREKEFGLKAFELFFKREFAADEVDATAALISSLGMSANDYRAYYEGDGKEKYERCQEEATEDHIFGVPMFMLRGEQFWGFDRMELLRHRLTELGLRKTPISAVS